MISWTDLVAIHPPTPSARAVLRRHARTARGRSARFEFWIGDTCRRPGARQDGVLRAAEERAPRDDVDDIEAPAAESRRRVELFGRVRTASATWRFSRPTERPDAAPPQTPRARRRAADDGRSPCARSTHRRTRDPRGRRSRRPGLELLEAAPALRSDPWVALTLGDASGVRDRGDRRAARRAAVFYVARAGSPPTR